MIRHVVILIAMLSACSAPVETAVSYHENVSSEDTAPVLPSDYFDFQSECISAWKDLLAEWQSYGNGVGESIMETRQKISVDNSSRLSAIVRRAWGAQTEQDARPMRELGQWPVSEKQYRDVMARVSFKPQDGLPAECEVTIWMNDFLWSELVTVHNGEAEVRKLREVPETMDWESPYAQHWIKYWLFIRLEP